MIPINLNLDRHVDNEKTRGSLSIDYQFAEVTNSPIKTPSHKDSSIKVNLLCLDQYMYTLDKEKGVKWEVEIFGDGRRKNALENQKRPEHQV